MAICFVLPDGSHTRGCMTHLGEHPYDWNCDGQKPTGAPGSQCESCRHTEPLAYIDGHFDGDGCAVFHAWNECAQQVRVNG